MAHELHGTNVTVQTVFPGIINTAIANPKSTGADISKSQVDRLVHFYATKGCTPDVVARDILSGIESGSGAHPDRTVRAVGLLDVPHLAGPRAQVHQEDGDTSRVPRRMNVLIVHAHNEPKSFSAAMKNLAVEELQGQGHSVELSDLYTMQWNPVASAADFGERANPDYLVYALEQRKGFETRTLAPDILAELEKLQRADLLIFNFPIYWFSMPAILKGWVDRVLISGLCYGGMRFYDRGGLKGIKSMLAITVGGRPHMLVEDGIHGDLNDMLRPILRGTLAYTGMTVLPPFVAHHVPYIPQAAREALLDDYRDRLRALDALPPLTFPSMSDFDDHLQPHTIGNCYV